MCVACTHQHSIALHSGLHVPPISSLPQFYSSVSHSLLNPLWRLRGIPFRIHGVLVLPTRKVQSLRAYKHLRLLTGTPCRTRVIQTSLFRAISDILRDANSDFMEHSTGHLSPPHPELMIITIAWLCLCSHHNLENLLSEAPPTMLNIQISKNLEEHNASHQTENSSNKDRRASSHGLGHSHAQFYPKTSGKCL